nr:hypothetical protein [Mesorhizobium sp.]
MLERVFDRLCVERRLRFLFGPVLLHAPALIAVKARCGKVAQIIGAAVLFAFLCSMVRRVGPVFVKSRLQ